MIEKLELKYLCGYLPYKLKYLSTIDGSIGSLYDISVDSVSLKGSFNLKNGTEEKHDLIVSIYEMDDKYLLSHKYFKPLLLPLSALTEQLPNGIIPIEILMNDGYYFEEDIDFSNEIIECWSLGAANRLLEWHFDIYGLIDVGLAIDKRTITTKN